MLSARLTFQRWRYPWWRHSTATPAGRAGLDVLNPRPQDLSFGLGMFRDHDVVVSLTRMTAVLVDASLRVVERLVAAQPAAQPAPNNVVRPRVLPSLSFHDVHCARLRRSMSRRDSSGGTAVESTRPEDTGGIAQHSHATGRVFICPRVGSSSRDGPPVLSYRAWQRPWECAVARFTRIPLRGSSVGHCGQPMGLPCHNLLSHTGPSPLTSEPWHAVGPHQAQD